MISPSADGTPIAFESHGSDADDVIVMLHSLGSSSAMWNPQIQALSGSHRVIAIDTRGHGNSAASVGDYDIDRLGTDVLAVVDHLDVPTFHTIGLSLGGQMAMWLAAAAPQRVRRLVLANTAAKLGSPDSWQSRIDAVAANGMASISDAVLARWFAPGFAERQPAMFAQLQQIFDRTDPTGYIGCCAALRDSDLRDTVARISAPTLIIGGALDLATPPSDAAWLHEHILGSELTIFGDAAHLSNLDRPDAFTDRVVRFLQQ